LRTVYIASNHASHAAFAESALQQGLDVYVEKPVAVDLAQISRLERTRRAAHGRLFAGYNRPFSGAVRALRQHLRIEPDAGISLQCFVAGHVLPPDHWYRRPEEGTRICGNVGHWLDLFVHLVSWRGMPDRLDICLTWANDAERDENLSIAIVSDHQDLCAIMLTARAEPFEGINESIQLQHGEAICKIDDFRRMTLWQGTHVLTRRYWPKDPGHCGAIYQPFGDTARPWQEVLDSSLLMLHITDMVRTATRFSTFSFREARRALDHAINAL
jgi:predicted dehydrogenase